MARIVAPPPPPPNHTQGADEKKIFPELRDSPPNYALPKEGGKDRKEGIAPGIQLSNPNERLVSGAEVYL